MQPKESPVVAAVFSIRPFRPTDLPLIASTLYLQLRMNGFAHGVSSSVLHPAVQRAIAYLATSPDWQIDVVTPSDESLDNEICGYVIYQRQPKLTIVFSYVKAPYRNMGAWKHMRDHLNLAEHDEVEIVLGAPNALYAARKHYQVRHVPYYLLEFIA